MGRPVNRVEIGLVEFVRLAFFMLACHESEYEVGDCNLVEHTLQILHDIQRNSRLSMTLEQLDALVFHYKQAVITQMDPSKTLKLTPDEYQSVMKRIRDAIPHHVRRNKLGAFEIHGFAHRYGGTKFRRKKFKEDLVTAAEREFIEAKV